MAAEFNFPGLRKMYSLLQAIRNIGRFLVNKNRKVKAC